MYTGYRAGDVPIEHIDWNYAFKVWIFNRACVHC
jgi:hypothetical protein